MTDHDRFAPVNLTKGNENPEYPKLLEALTTDEKLRIDFMKACLAKLGLRVNEGSSDVPSLSRLHLSSAKPADITHLASTLSNSVTMEDGQEYIKAENDTFAIERPSKFSVAHLKDVLPEVLQTNVEGKAKQPEDSATRSAATQRASSDNTAEDKMIDYEKIIKHLILHESGSPEGKSTPYFNHHAYFANLQTYQSMSRKIDPSFGNMLLYGEVVTSTNTLLEKSATYHPR